MYGLIKHNIKMLTVAFDFLAICESVVLTMKFSLQVKTEIASGEFKPNCALVILDFLIRKGYLSVDTGQLAGLLGPLGSSLPPPSPVLTR